MKEFRAATYLQEQLFDQDNCPLLRFRFRSVANLYLTPDTDGLLEWA